MKQQKAHTNLAVWQDSIALVKDIYILTNSFPEDEFSGLVSRLREIVISIPTNISKGFSMRLKSEINVFLIKAQNAIAETDTLLLISYELGYINQKDLDIFSLKTDNIEAQINGLIKKFERELIEENNQ
jgi:four helix bundle protein